MMLCEYIGNILDVVPALQWCVWTDLFLQLYLNLEAKVCVSMTFLLQTFQY